MELGVAQRSNPLYVTLCALLTSGPAADAPRAESDAESARRRRGRRDVVAWGPRFVALVNVAVVLEGADALVCEIDGRRFLVPKAGIVNRDPPAVGHRGLIVIARPLAVELGVVARG